MKHTLRIVFMGTPEFAVPGLEILLENGFNIVGVITAVDKPAGRGLKLHQSAVKTAALKHGLKVLQPPNLKSPEFLQELAALKADLQVVVAFRMLPELVWNMPPLGTLNLHASLLPQYRGAAPINWAIINGERITGLSTFLLKHEIDTGNIIFQVKVPIRPNDTAGSLHDKMMPVGAGLILETVSAIEQGSFTQRSQSSETTLRKAPRIHKEDCEINWDDACLNTYNHIRGLSPYPCAWTKFQGKHLKIYFAEVLKSSHNLTPGEFETDGKTYLRIACQDGLLNIKDLQIEGKKRMGIEEFLRGYRFQ